MTRTANQDFTLTRDDCRPVAFLAGQEIPAEYAEHWWVLLHSDEAEEVTTGESDATQEKRKPGRPAKS